MSNLGWYNGFSPGQRDRNFAVLKQQIVEGFVRAAAGPCRLCGDPIGSPDRRTGVTFEYHTEDYTLPLLLGEPNLVILCIHCHRAKLHKRFSDPSGWLAFLAHIRRGGYARDLKISSVAREVKGVKTALMARRGADLEILRERQTSDLLGWFSALSTDVQSLACGPNLSATLKMQRLPTIPADLIREKTSSKPLCSSVVGGKNA
jgi:hypothetical protein